MTDFEKELRDKIIERLGLGDVDRDALTSDTALFGSGLELDSIDALEIEALIAEEYGITIIPAERSASTFANFGTLARFVQDNLRRDAPDKG
jgi:acyl carrier protein